MSLNAAYHNINLESVANSVVLLFPRFLQLRMAMEESLAESGSATAPLVMDSDEDSDTEYEEDGEGGGKSGNQSRTTDQRPILTAEGKGTSVCKVRKTRAYGPVHLACGGERERNREKDKDKGKEKKKADEL